MYFLFNIERMGEKIRHPAAGDLFRDSLAAETAHLSKDLPDGAAIRIAVGVARKEKHCITSCIQYLSREDRYDCS